MRLSLASLTVAAVLAEARRCAAQIKPNNLATTSTSGALSALKYTNVGGSGTYNEVTDILPGTFPTCDANPFCVTKPKQITGKLAPFDDEMTVAFRGPLNLYNIAVYQPTNSSSATWKQVSSWAADQEPSNLVFMNNMGGQESGEWSICAGSSQSYASGDWTASAKSANAQLAKGALDETHEINIMTGAACSSSDPCTGFSRGTANHGWGGSKFFVFTFDMPASSDASKVPAIWALNAQIVRAAQYGCNCRGVGPGGCGELDILETLAADGANPDQAISEIYSPKGATGTGRSFFARPKDGKVTYGVIFDVQTDSIAIQRYTDWNYAQNAVTRSVVDGYLNAQAMTVSFEGASANARRADMPRSVLGAHKRRRWH